MQECLRSQISSTWQQSPQPPCSGSAPRLWHPSPLYVPWRWCLPSAPWPYETVTVPPHGASTESLQLQTFAYTRSGRNRFGIWANRWRVFLTTIMLNPDKVQKMAFATLCFHNYLREVRSDTYTPPGLANTEDENHRLVEGSWRVDGLGAMLPLQPGRCGNSYMAAKALRNDLKSYFVTPAGQVPWQNNYI